MKFLSYLLSTFNYNKLFLDLRDRKFYHEQLLKNKESVTFKKYNIFINWYKHMCVLISLNEDEQYLSQRNEYMEDSIFYDKLNEINGFITNRMLCGDILIPYTRKIPNSWSYTIVYKPAYRVISFSWILRNISFYALLITLIICL